MKQRRGFTLIELLMIVAVIAILAAIVYSVMDPVRRFAEARNSERWNEVNSILNGILKYSLDNKGALPANLAAANPGNYYMIGTAATGCDIGCTAQTTQPLCIDLAPGLANQDLSSIPMDPSAGTAAKTLYYISVSSLGQVTVGACAPEPIGGKMPDISVSR